MMIESDFYATDAGRQHFADQLKSIRYCVQETCNFDALYAYLTCGNYDFNYDRAKNLRPKRNIRTAMNNEIMMYAIAQVRIAFRMPSRRSPPDAPAHPVCVRLCRRSSRRAEGADGLRQGRGGVQ